MAGRRAPGGVGRRGAGGHRVGQVGGRGGALPGPVRPGRAGPGGRGRGGGPTGGARAARRARLHLHRPGRGLRARPGGRRGGARGRGGGGREAPGGDRGRGRAALPGGGPRARRSAGAAGPGGDPGGGRRGRPVAGRAGAQARAVHHPAAGPRADAVARTAAPGPGQRPPGPAAVRLRAVGPAGRRRYGGPGPALPGLGRPGLAEALPVVLRFRRRHRPAGVRGSGRGAGGARFGAADAARTRGRLRRVHGADRTALHAAGRDRRHPPAAPRAGPAGRPGRRGPSAARRPGRAELRQRGRPADAHRAGPGADRRLLGVRHRARRDRPPVLRAVERRAAVGGGPDGGVRPGGAGDARAFSLDSPRSRVPKIAALRANSGE